jgi:hypothetical protein
MAKKSLTMASCGSENSATVPSSSIRTSYPESPGFGDVRTELKIDSAADVGGVSLETESAIILIHSRKEFSPAFALLINQRSIIADYSRGKCWCRNCAVAKLQIHVFYLGLQIAKHSD